MDATFESKEAEVKMMGPERFERSTDRCLLKV